ncbi:DsbC family protein [Coralloluteibacterium stylophorae]|uniref:Thiol:disulfide interchange protein n=1 Tax=Coralloluteibacterium stylophorae TaxID=1776034 RepID=A0A8J7VU71_9GAMM|nr:DsbC family protein [Coralloluteibacterium stylophorae]MBS7457787.1 DsbC family protein [Coralloluteibacterium stylophorae]
MSRIAAVALIGAFSLAACAAEGDRDAAGTAVGRDPATAPAASPSASAGGAQESDAAATARRVVEELIPQVPVDRVSDAPLPGYQEVLVAGQLLYVSNDGRYLVQGNVLDVENKRDLTEASKADIRRDVLATMDRSQRIVFAPENPDYTVTVFTDIECGYCQKLHSEIEDYNARGIAVEYLFFPRSGLDGSAYRKAVSVWCADDRRQALTDAKAGRSVPGRSCDNPVAADFEAGQRMGIEGTPAVFNEDGRQLGGYLPAAQMRQRLDQLAGKG